MRPPTSLPRRGAACPPSTSGRRERRIRVGAPRASSSPSPSSNLAPPNAAGVDGGPPPPPPAVTVTTVESMADVPASQWDAVVRSQAEYNPFVSHTFLRLLEGEEWGKSRGGGGKGGAWMRF